ncbi:MAG TPA: glycerol-3-phosphate 1-O-acyltransferase PlsY [Thermoanaerobaculia bacterium]|nr:glycerol-3-phosphate 1-O-acyltransferase PlsY [Thermoanaerobaculia bacterium]
MPNSLPLMLIGSSYLLGSIPFSYLVVRLFAGQDIRQLGSGNVGATNVLRNFGKLPGIIALLLDIAKGWAAVAIAGAMTEDPAWKTSGSELMRLTTFWLGLACLLVVLGHMFPVWLRFKGGKGVATATGAFLALDARVVAGAAIIFLIVILLTRYVSLASIVAAAAVPLFFRFLVQAPLWLNLLSIAVSIAVIARHHQNISRLANGRERKLGSATKEEDR